MNIQIKIIKENEDETLYTLELEKNQNPEEILFLMKYPQQN